MINEKQVKRLSKQELKGQFESTLALAFQDDPAFAWIIPDQERRRRMFPNFFAIMREQSHRHGSVLASTGGETASLWYDPGEQRETALQALWDNLRMGPLFGLSLKRGLEVAEAIHAHHPQPQAYSYLRYVGVAPLHQGKGWGGACIREGIKRAAAKGQGVLLETATPGNVPIYLRLGFQVREEWQVAGGGPTFWTMVREAGSTH